MPKGRRKRAPKRGVIDRTKYDISWLKEGSLVWTPYHSDQLKDNAFYKGKIMKINLDKFTVDVKFFGTNKVEKEVWLELVL